MGGVGHRGEFLGPGKSASKNPWKKGWVRKPAQKGVGIRKRRQKGRKQKAILAKDNLRRVVCWGLGQQGEVRIRDGTAEKNCRSRWREKHIKRPQKQKNETKGKKTEGGGEFKKEIRPKKTTHQGKRSAKLVSRGQQKGPLRRAPRIT